MKRHVVVGEAVEILEGQNVYCGLAYYSIS
jgi:hypothetical protein